MTRYDAGMQHSIATSARVPRFVHPTARRRERRLGLHAGPVFVPAALASVPSGAAAAGPVDAVRTRSRALTVAPVRPVHGGRPRPATAMAWTSSMREGGARRPVAAPAWRA